MPTGEFPAWLASPVGTAGTFKDGCVLTLPLGPEEKADWREFFESLQRNIYISHWDEPRENQMNHYGFLFPQEGS